MLASKRILVTGGSRGLGQALCEGFAAEGATRIGFSYSRDDEGALVTLERLKALGVEGRSYKASVLDGAATAAMTKDLEAAWGGIDVLVNNAGMSQLLPVALISGDDWDEVMDVNAKGAFLTSREVLRGMIRRRSGVILNMGSLASAKLVDAPVHYCASKAALRGLTQSLAKEVARYGVRVNCLAPGLLEDSSKGKLPEHRLEDYVRHTALGRLGTLAEVAAFAAFLVSDANSYMSGETILMDGGL